MSFRKFLYCALICAFVAPMAIAGSPAGLSKAEMQSEAAAKKGLITPAGPPGGSDAGGETCATATVISALPYSDSGNTTGAANDYQGSCATNTAPDHVYRYTPSSNQTVNVSLCGSSYDTVLYVYSGASCPGTEIGCIDDACGLQSELTGLAMTAGTTYHIVVDGYSTGSGAYTINVTAGTAGAGCGSVANLLYGQDPHGTTAAWSAATSSNAQTGIDYTVYENWPTGTPMLIQDAHWFGLSLSWNGGWSNCTPSNVPFAVNVWDNVGGLPGTAQCTYTITPTATNTGASYAGYPLFQFDATLSPSCDMTAGVSGWLSVRSNANANSCNFLWMSAATGDGISLQQTGTATPVSTAYDRAVCFTGLPPVELQSFSVE